MSLKVSGNDHVNRNKFSDNDFISEAHKMITESSYDMSDEEDDIYIT